MYETSFRIPGLLRSSSLRTDAPEPRTHRSPADQGNGRSIWMMASATAARSGPTTSGRTPPSNGASLLSMCDVCAVVHHGDPLPGVSMSIPRPDQSREDLPGPRGVAVHQRASRRPFRSGGSGSPGASRSRPSGSSPYVRRARRARRARNRWRWCRRSPIRVLGFPGHVALPASPRPASSGPDVSQKPDQLRNAGYSA